MTDSISIDAPAKLNLRLKVLGRREEDGYHLLSMLNSTINLFDRITLSRLQDSSQIQLITEGCPQILARTGDPAQNLVVSAARGFLERFGIENAGLRIKLEKNIPVGAGLGGGSSDAAATIKALAKLFAAEVGFEPGDRELTEIASRVGSDVPYFISAGLCTVFGTGEIVEALGKNPLAGHPVLLVMPDQHISTREIFGRLRSSKADLPLTSAKGVSPKCGGLTELKPGLSYEQILELIDNDLSEELFRCSPLCSEIYALLKQQKDLVVSVTGSGSAMFCLPLKQGNAEVLEKSQKILTKLSKSRIVCFL